MRPDTDDFESPRGEVLAIRRLARDDWDIRTRTVLTGDSEQFHLYAELDAYESGQRVYSRNWSRWIARKHV